MTIWLLTGYKEGDEEGFLFISDGSKGFITKISTTGEVIWDKNLSAMQGTKVKKTSKGGFVVGSVEWVDAGLKCINALFRLKWKYTLN
jgi:hypothetical protein